MAQRPLSCLQYSVLYLSRMQRICPPWYLNLYSTSHQPVFVPIERYRLKNLWSLPEGYAYSWYITGVTFIDTFQHGFWLRGVQPQSYAWQLLGIDVSINRICQLCEPTIGLILWASWTDGLATACPPWHLLQYPMSAPQRPEIQENHLQLVCAKYK